MSSLDFLDRMGIFPIRGNDRASGNLVRLLILLSVAIFSTELTIAFGFGQIHLSRTIFQFIGFDFPNIRNTVFEGVIDALLLTIIVFPGLYFFVFNKLDEQNQKLMESEAKLEQRVAARTRELEQAVDRATRQQRQIAALNEMGQALQECRTPDDAYRVSSEQLSRIFPELSGSVYLKDQVRDVLVKVAEWGGKPNSQSDTPSNKVQRRDQRRLRVPLTAQGEALGVLCLDADCDHASEGAGRPLQHRMQFYGAVAKNLALAISNLRLRELLQQQALQDPLTGLPNRRFLVATLEREMHRSVRHGQPLSVIMLDVDNFKAFNDRFGHEAGDAVLVELGTLLRQSVRGEDAVSRYGGEEFVVLLPGADQNVALRRAETIREKVGSLTVDYHSQPLGRITISAGIAVFPLHAKDPIALVRAADQAMYTSKRNGRNRASLAPSS